MNNLDSSASLQQDTKDDVEPAIEVDKVSVDEILQQGRPKSVIVEASPSTEKTDHQESSSIGNRRFLHEGKHYTFYYLYLRRSLAS